MKLLKTILLSITFVSAALLWFTRETYMPSLSSFALSDNALFYRAMHISAILFFMTNAITFKKYATEYALAGGMALILIFDMYNHPTLHTIFTVATLLLACLTLLINSVLKVALGVVIVGTAIATFVIGYFTSMHFLLAEVLAMLFLTVGKLIEVYKYDR